MYIAEEITLRLGERKPYVKFRLEKRYCAREVCNLKKPVSFRRDIRRKLNGKSRERVFENILDLRLPVVVIYLQFFKSAKYVTACFKMSGDLICEGLRHLFRRTEVALVDAKGMSPHRCSPGKCEKTAKKFSANLYAHVLERLFAANERSGMKADIRTYNVCKGMLKPCDLFRDIDHLIVEYARDDVKSGGVDARIKTARFVNKYAQRVPAIHHAICASEKTGGDFSPPVRWGLPLPVGGSDLRLCHLSDFSNNAYYIKFPVAA